MSENMTCPEPSTAVSESFPGAVQAVQWFFTYQSSPTRKVLKQTSYVIIVRNNGAAGVAEELYDESEKSDKSGKGR